MKSSAVQPAQLAQVVEQGCPCGCGSAGLGCSAARKVLQGGPVGKVKTIGKANSSHYYPKKSKQCTGAPGRWCVTPGWLHTGALAAAQTVL
jgi:hypothetical protein